MKKLAILLCLCCWSWIGRAQLVLDGVYQVGELKVHELQGATRILPDSAGRYEPRAVAAGAYDSLFVSPEQYTACRNYWLRLEVRAVDTLEDWWLIVLNNDYEQQYLYTAQNEYVDVYEVGEKGRLLSHQRGGAFHPASERAVAGRPGVNRVLVNLLPGQGRTFYVQIRNDNNPPRQVNTLELRHPARVIPVNDVTLIVRTNAAITTMFLLLSLSFFFYLRDRAYLLFALYLAVLSFHYLLLDPQLPFIQFFAPELPQYNDMYWAILTMGAQLVFLLFGRAFTQLPSLAPRLDKWLKAAMIFLSVWYAFHILLAANGSDLLLRITPLVFFVLSLALVIQIGLLPSPLAKLFAVGAIWLYVFQLLGVLGQLQLIPTFFNYWTVGQLGQIAIFAFGLAYKFRLYETARAEAERIKELDVIKSRFFANISHEFRTPLTLIHGPLKQLERQAGKAETVSIPQRYVTAMRRNTDRLLELVNQLLDLSKLDAGKMRLQIVKGDVVQLLRALTFSFESMAERKQIHLQTHFPEQTILAYFDKDKLEKIVVNLLANAFKYTPERGMVSIEVSLAEGRLRIGIQDSGPGIPKKEIDKVFNRFYQVEGTEDQGTGIGLALVKELVELYRGQITLGNAPGGGAHFKVSLPYENEDFQPEELLDGLYYQEAVDVEPALAAAGLLTEDRPTTAASIGRSEDLAQVLIVEDNPDLRQFIRESLFPHYDIREATDGAEGLTMAYEHIPDLIISDVMMPRMDGFALTERLKKDERTSHIPVILLTAKAGQQHKVEGLETGADDYLTKPFDTDELLVRIDNLIRQRRLLRRKFAERVSLRPKEVAATSVDEQFLSKVMETVEANLGDETFGVETLAAAVAMSRSQLHRKLSALIDQSPSALIRQTRLQRAKSLLEQRAGTASEIAFRVGFNSHSYFSRCFKEEFGYSPGETVGG